MTKGIVVQLALLLLVGAAGCARDVDWQTRAERTNYSHTARFDETVDYCRALERSSPWVKLLSVGKTPEGRDMPLVVLSKERAFTPSQAAKTGKAIILIYNGVHAGEIEGKDASLALMREIAVTRSLSGLLDHVVLIVLPIFNIDGHERFGPFNRINQNGPSEMGWRCTAQNLNLNRDFMKADAPEMEAFLRMFHSWRPHLWIDTHTTDGADFQYDVTFGAASGAENAPTVARYVNDTLHPTLLKALEARGHVPQLFFDLRDRLDPSKGIETNFGFAPRFSTGYGAITNRPSILVETHMLKPYDVRVRATYDLFVEALLLVNRNPAALIDVVRQADEQTCGLASRTADVVPVVLTTTRPADDAGRPVIFKGYALAMNHSEAAGAEYPVWDQAQPVDSPSKLYSKTVAERIIRMPAGYIIPPQWTAVIHRLEIHGVPMRRLTRSVTIPVETYRFHDIHWHERPFEGRHEVTYQADLVRETRTYREGSVVVLLNHPTAKVAAHLLEPAAPDSLVHWGFFDAIFEQKEYYEDYAMAPIADKMLKDDPALRREFDAWLQANPSTSSNSGTRLDFFFKHSPYWDQQKDAYPIGRLTESPAALPTSHK